MFRKAQGWPSLGFRPFIKQNRFPSFIKEILMRNVAIGFALAGLVAGGIWMQTSSHAGEKKSDNLCHMVYFKLKDNSPKAVNTLVESCKKHLSGHDGTVYFSAGVLAQDLKRDVNDRDFDVALHLVF